MYNPNTVTDSLDFEMTEIASQQSEEHEVSHEAELPPAVQFVLDVGTQLSHIRKMRLEQEEVA